MGEGGAFLPDLSDEWKEAYIAYVKAGGEIEYGYGHPDNTMGAMNVRKPVEELTVQELNANVVALTRDHRQQVLNARQDYYSEAIDVVLTRTQAQWLLNFLDRFTGVSGVADEAITIGEMTGGTAVLRKGLNSQWGKAGASVGFVAAAMDVTSNNLGRIQQELRTQLTVNQADNFIVEFTMDRYGRYVLINGVEISTHNWKPFNAAPQVIAWWFFTNIKSESCSYPTCRG
jgi:hypothetical protein